LCPDWDRYVHQSQHAAMRENFAVRDLAFETTLARRLGETRQVGGKEQAAHKLPTSPVPKT